MWKALYLIVEAQRLQAFSLHVCIAHLFDLLSSYAKDPLHLQGGAKKLKSFSLAGAAESLTC